MNFGIDYEKAKSKSGAVFTGSNYRITVLTERLVRLEYSREGIFCDDLTEQVINRDFPIPNFKVVQDDRYLEITTKYFMLKYQKGKPFEGLNLEIMLLNTDKSWYFKNKEVRNFGTSGDGFNLDKIDIKKGLYSTDGFVSLDDSNSMILSGDGFLMPSSTKRIDTYVFMYRRDFGLCLTDYYTLTGYPPMIPRYALGIWWNKSEIYNFANIDELISNFNKYKIPISVLLLPEYWHLKDAKDLSLYHTGFTFNRNLFSDPNFLVKYLHEHNIKLGLMMDPSEGIMPHEDNYEIVARNLGISDRSVIPFNALDRTIIDNYLNVLIKPLENMGVDFFFLDLKDTKNPYLNRALVHYHFDKENTNVYKRGMILARNTNIASHRYPVLYSGNTLVSWDTLKNIPYFNALGSNKGLSFWSHDIGGYMGGVEDANLYVRYIELGVFSPIFRLASLGGKYYKREPWKWDVKTLKITEDYTRLRHELIPYIYTESYKYHKNGVPLIMPLYYENPEIYDEPDYKNEYKFGSELLVSPIIHSKDLLMNRTVHRLFLPDGVWYDFKTGKKFIGNKRYVAFYKDEDYPVFARSGSIIPKAIIDENVNDTRAPKKMEIHIFPGKSNIYKLYEDDGESSMYENGYYIKTSIDYNYLQNNYTVIIRPTEGKSGIIPDTRDYIVKFRNTRKADEVITYIDKDIVDSVSYVMDNDFIVEVSNVKTTSQLSINCKGKDIEIDASRLINEDIDSIINDLQIKTNLKIMLADIIFNDELDIKKKRIMIRKLKSRGLEDKFIKMFMRLMEYVSEI